MKKLVLFIITFVSITTQAQTKYTITFAANNNLKETINELTEGILTFDRFVLEDNSVTFSSYSILSDDYIKNRAGNQTVLGISREKFSQESINEKAGGNNCPQAQMLCNNSSFAANSGGPGIQELNNSNRGCLYQENQSSWYYVNIQTAGVLKFRINPNNNNNDYDFAVWGPFTSTTASANCPPTSAPIRCNYSAESGNTGLSSAGSSTSQNQYGSKWSSPINVLANQVYILLIDNYSATNSGYNLDFSWSGETSTAVLGCLTVVLPIELISFNGTKTANSNFLTWSTASEMNNDYFTIEQSEDGINWNKIAYINGAGSASNINHYSFEYSNFKNIINYYRLSQTDFDGQKRIFSTIAIDNTMKQKEILKVTNLLGQNVDEDFEGIKIILYSDGTTLKKMGK